MFFIAYHRAFFSYTFRCIIKHYTRIILFFLFLIRLFTIHDMLATVLLIEVLNVLHVLLIIFLIHLLLLFLACISMRIRIKFFEWIEAKVVVGDVDSIGVLLAIFEAGGTTNLFIYSWMRCWAHNLLFMAFNVVFGLLKWIIWFSVAIFFVTFFLFVGCFVIWQFLEVKWRNRNIPNILECWPLKNVRVIGYIFVAIIRVKTQLVWFIFAILVFI